MTGERPRNPTLGSVAERYEWFRPGKPEALRELVLAETRSETALEVGAGAGKVGDPSQMAVSEWATRRGWRCLSGRPVADGGV